LGKRSRQYFTTVIGAAIVNEDAFSDDAAEH
jgi:hypothetical protein